MRHLLRLGLRVGIAAALCGLMTTQSAKAALSLSLKVGSAATLDVTSYLASEGGGVYSFGGNGSYLLINVAGTISGSSPNPRPSASSLPNGVIAIKVTLTDNAPGGSQAQLFNLTHDVRSGGGGSPRDVVITAMDNAFNAPSGMVTLEGSFSGSGQDGNTTLSFESSVIQGTSTLASVSGTGESDPFNLTGTYTLKNVTTITSVNPNEVISTSGYTYVNSPPPPPPIVTTTIATPEPATWAMAVASFPLVGLVAWRNRRRSRA